MWGGISGKKDREIEATEERLEEMICDLVHDVEYQDQFIADDPMEFVFYLRRYFPDAIQSYIMDNYEEIKDLIREQIEEGN